MSGRHGVHAYQQLRFLAGVESLNGLLLISCPAALIHVLMTGRDLD
jgi:hypothetical protein